MLNNIYSACMEIGLVENRRLRYASFASRSFSFFCSDFSFSVSSVLQVLIGVGSTNADTLVLVPATDPVWLFGSVAAHSMLIHEMVRNRQIVSKAVKRDMI